MIVKVDEHDFVISVEREAVDSALREIQRSDQMPEATRICKGPYHNRGGGKGTPLPLSMFRPSYRAPGEFTKTCVKCLDDNNKRRTSVVEAVVKATPVPVAIPDHVAPLGNGGVQHKWEVTIVKQTVVVVYAKDYMDAGVEAGEGDVINVRRLD